MNIYLQHLNIISPLQLYYNPYLILYRLQLWRLFTTFLFFGSSVGIGFFFNIIFTYRYCRMLEEGSFRGRSSDFVVMFMFGATLMTIMGVFINLLFLGQAFTLMFVYVWSRRNPFIRMNILGVVNFQVFITDTRYRFMSVDGLVVCLGSLFAMGVALFLHDPRQCDLDRYRWHGRRSHLFLPGGCLSAAA